MNYIFIVNPISGNKKGLAAGEVINEYCKDKKINYKVIYTNKKNDATKIAEHYSDTNNIIYSVGGDGTLNEVVNGMSLKDSNLGVIPVGTGNDFYKSISSFNRNKIDLGKVNDRYFINVASLGLDASIADYANELKKGSVSGKQAYILSLIHEYFSYKPIDIKIDKRNIKSTILTVCNGKYYGGGFKIAPRAVLNDGMFDIIEVESLNKIKIINLIIKLLNEKHLNSTYVNFYRTDKLSVESLVPLICNIDGEIIKGTKFDFSTIKRALKLDNDSKTYIEICKLLKTKKLIK